MKKIIIIIACLLFTNSAFAWSRAIHSAIAAIADANLTEQAKEKINNALDGHNLSYYAQWLYDVAEEEAYSQSKKWVNVPLTNKNKLIKSKKAAAHSEKIVQNAQALDGLFAAIGAIESGNLTKEQLADNIRYIITIMGDLHCPTHYIFTDLLEKRKSYYYTPSSDKKNSYMTYWENNAMRGTFSWRTSEYVHQLNRKSPEQVAQITNGSITNWVLSNAPIYREVYGMLDTGTKFTKTSYRLWQNKMYPIAAEQIAVAGYRLAAVLNGLFDQSVPNVKTK